MHIVATSTSTSRVLVIGSLLSSLLFLTGVIVGSTGLHAVTEPVSPLLDPAVWSSAGIAVLLATPVVGLFVTAWEYRRVDSKSAIIALCVLTLLGVSVAVALMA